MTNLTTRILVLGASGMLGNAIIRYFSQFEEFEVFGTIRSPKCLAFFSPEIQKNIFSNIDVLNPVDLNNAFIKIRPNVVINCIGLVKQLGDSKNPLKAIPINAEFPHRLAQICDLGNARLIHFGTDCVFSGNKGMYSELDLPDANDLYGRSKFLGEVSARHCITLRTSIIGTELDSHSSLVGWFLNQSNEVKGYRNAIFSGLPTVEIARIIRQFVLPNKNLSGMYHLSAEPICKFDLLNLVAKEYGKDISIIPDETLKIDRSLNSDNFRNVTGYIPRDWTTLIKEMKQFS
ncbi:dTDP-4-dehydrorhamnose reductase family protein [Undibacterium sp. WLHG33]|uniref:dTDP-4-dehydrorhamnose reductase family protein n=1 Tax=Undibacterium sp. WLHG33 TaxID=3412482 RepID=UPI003C2CDC45